MLVCISIEPPFTEVVTPSEVLLAQIDFVNEDYTINGETVTLGSFLTLNGGSVVPGQGLVIPENSAPSEIIGDLFNLFAATFEFVLVIEWEKDTGSTPTNGQALFGMEQPSLFENFIELFFDTLGPGSQTLRWTDGDNAAFQEGSRDVTLFWAAPGIDDGVYKAAVRRVANSIAISFMGDPTENNSGPSGSGPLVVEFSSPPTKAYFGRSTGNHEPTIIRTVSLYTSDVLETDLNELSAPEAWAIIPSLFTESDTFFGHTIAGDGALVQGTTFTETDTFFTPSVSYGLAPNLFTESDTFFTPTVQAGLTLDGLSPTGAWSASRDLLTTYIGGGRYTDDGGGAISNFDDQSGNNRDLSGSGSGRPTLTTAGPNSRSCLDFDGSGNNLQGAAASSFVTASTGYMVVSFIVDAVAGNNANAFTNDALLGDIGGFMGLYLKNTSPISAQSFNWDAGGEDTASSNVISTGTPYVVEWRHEGGTLYVRVNGTGEQSLAAGDTGSLASALNMGNGYTGTANLFNGKIFEAATFSTVPGSTDRDTIVADMMAWIGA